MEREMWLMLVCSFTPLIVSLAGIFGGLYLYPASPPCDRSRPQYEENVWRARIIIAIGVLLLPFACWYPILLWSWRGAG